MGRKMNPKSQQNDRQNPGFLQIPLLQFNENAMQTKGDWVLHRELNNGAMFHIVFSRHARNFLHQVVEW
jgi:hypothetical protein